MEIIKIDSGKLVKPNRENGFTLIEVLVAGSIMIILSIGILTVFSYAVNINRGENIRAQALSALQLEVEYYRSLKFVPGAQTTADLPNHRDPNLRAGTHTLSPVTTADLRVFNVSAVVTNLQHKPSTTVDEAHSIYKEITITAVPQVAETGWLANLRTTVTIQRVRSN